MSETLTSTSTLKSESRHGWKRTLLGRDAVMIYALLVVVIYCSLGVNRFASPTTVGFLLLDIIPTLLMAMPMTLILVTGEIDLSVASVAGLTCAVMGVLWTNPETQAHRLDIWAAIGLSLLVAMAAGAVNGVLIAFVGLPSLAVTIGTLALFRGLALVVIGDNAVANFPTAFTEFASSKLGATGIPTAMIMVAVVVVIFAIVLHFTPFGRGLYAMGFSKEAATFVGINVLRSKFWLYLASGTVSGLAGVFWTLRYASARSDNAEGLEMMVIAAVLLGGVSAFGGKGSIPGALAGVLLIGTINYALKLGRISDVVLITVTGVLLIVSVVTPSITSAISARIHNIKTRKTMETITHSTVA